MQSRVPQIPRTHRLRLRPWAALCLLSITLSACGGGGGGESIETPSQWMMFPHDQMSFALTVTSDFDVTQINNPRGWRLVKPGANDATPRPFRQAVWTQAFFLGSTRSRPDITRNALSEELGFVQTQLNQAASSLSLNLPDQVRFNLNDTFLGRDRFGFPVALREFNLQLPSIDTATVGRILNWAGQTLGVSLGIPQTGNRARNFRILAAISAAYDQFQEPVRDNQDRRIAAVSLSVVVPERIDPPEYTRDAVELMRTLPFTTRFAGITTVTDELQRPEEDAPLAVMVVIDRQDYTGFEQDNIQTRVGEIVENALIRGVQIDVGVVSSCDDTPVTPGAGADPMVAVRPDNSEAALDEIRARIAAVYADDDCNQFRFLRSAILSAQSLGDRFAGAEERSIWWILKHSDQSPSLDDPNAQPAAGELTDALADLDATNFVVSPLDRACARTEARGQQDQGRSFWNQIRDLDSFALEYCEAWQEDLQTFLRRRSARAAGLALSQTPLPGTLQVERRGERLPEDAPNGFSFDRAEGIITPGGSVPFSAGEIWIARYRAVVEPETGDDGIGGINF